MNEYNDYEEYQVQLSKFIKNIKLKKEKESIYWNKINEYNMARDYLKYIENYPNGIYLKRAQFKYKEELEYENKIEDFIKILKDNNIDYGDSMIRLSGGSLYEIKIAKELHLNFRKAFQIIPINITCLKNLRGLKISFLPENVNILPLLIDETIELEKIWVHASYLNEIFDFNSSKNLKFLKKIKITNNNTSIALSQNIENLQNLEYLDIRNSKEIEYPQTIKNLKKLKKLVYTGSSLSLEILLKIQQIEDLTIDCKNNFNFNNASFLKNLRHITFSRNDNTFIPEWIKKCKKLESIDISNSEIQLPDWIGEIQSLKKISGYKSHRITKLPNTIDSLVNLEEISFSHCLGLRLPNSIGSLENLKAIYLGKFCDTYLPNSIIELKQLEHFDFYINVYEEFYEKLTHYKYISKEISEFIVTMLQKEGYSVKSIQKDISEYNQKLRVKDDKLWNYDSLNYLNECPINGYYVNEAKEENLWLKAVEINTQKAYENYLTKYPNGLYIDDAKNKIKFLSNSLVRLWKYLY